MSKGNGRELPKGWASATLSDLVGCDGIFCDGDWVESKDQDPHGDVRLVQLADIGDGSYRDRSHRYLTSATAKELRCTYIKAGDLLIARMPDPLGRACLFPGDSKPCVTVVDVCIVRPESAISSSWLVHQLNSPQMRRMVAKLQSGTTRKRISRANLATISFPIPPLTEQTRIADKLDELLSDLDAGVAALERVRAKLKHYRAAVLKAAVEGSLTADWRAQHPATEPAPALLTRMLAERRRRWEEAQLQKFKAAGKEPPKNWRAKYQEPVPAESTPLPALPPGWVVASMDQLTSRITSGSRDWQQFYGSGTGTFIMAQNVRPGHFDMSFRQSVNPPATDSSCERSMVVRGDLLVTIVGANTGDVCRVPEDVTEHYVCQSVALMRPVETSTAQYLDVYFNSPGGGQFHYGRYLYGAGRPHLSFDQLRMTPVLLPPPAEQAAIVELVEDQLSVIDHVEADLDAKLKSAQALRQSVLRDAFAGKLVPQDPKDEPASELLKRIAAERATRARLAAAEKPKRKARER